MFAMSSHRGTGGDTAIPLILRKRYQTPIITLSAIETALPNTITVDIINPLEAKGRRCARKASTKQPLQISATREKNASFSISVLT